MPVLRGEAYIYAPGPIEHHVACKNPYCYAETAGWSTEAEAIKAWNTRAEPPCGGNYCPLCGAKSMDKELRVYECEYYSVKAPSTCCLFCAFCSDVFFDYTNGPYMFLCDMGADTEIGVTGKCQLFVEGYETEVDR